MHEDQWQPGSLWCILTLPCLKHRGFLVPRDGLRPFPCEGGSSGHVSPGVSLPYEEGKAVPLCPKVQFQGFEQDVERGVVVPVKDEPTPRTEARDSAGHHS